MSGLGLLIATVSAPVADLLGSLFVVPIDLPSWLRLWMFLPLAACIAVVYRATRARSVAEMPRATVLTFVNIVLGMVAIAVAAYGVHALVLWLS
ncbi:MAG: hypothetical protein LC135_07645 [Phycisphaerae bacterium]|nr:hypothetical protein [Phycisphaerae bacterium]MCZ2399727.1 hypothetical protein [Phycisphaerae bacterium]NUQ49782.1 hypothetical protein [Phycisphaerae bacterium]